MLTNKHFGQILYCALMSPNSKTPTHGHDGRHIPVIIKKFQGIYNHWKEFNLTLMFYHTCNKQKLIWVIQISLPTSNIYSKLKINNQWQNVQVIISRPAPCFLLSFLSAPNPLSLAIGICRFKEKVRSSFSLFSVHTSLFSKTFLFAAFANLLSCSSLSKNHNKR